MKKILEFLEPLNNDCVQVIIDINDVPKGFMQIENLVNNKFKLFLQEEM